MCRIRPYIPNSVLLNLYYTIIYPYLTYCNVIWCGTYWSHLNSIWLQQKRAIRVINWKPPRYHTSELFSESKILKLSDIHKLSLGIFMFKNQSHPKFVRNDTLNLRSQNHIRPIFPRLTLVKHSVFYSGPKLWNNLPVQITNSVSIPSFKTKLRNHLISLYSQ